MTLPCLYVCLTALSAAVLLIWPPPPPACLQISTGRCSPRPAPVDLPLPHSIGLPLDRRATTPGALALIPPNPPSRSPPTPTPPCNTRPDRVARISPAYPIHCFTLGPIFSSSCSLRYAQSVHVSTPASPCLGCDVTPELGCSSTSLIPPKQPSFTTQLSPLLLSAASVLGAQPDVSFFPLPPSSFPPATRVPFSGTT